MSKLTSTLVTLAIGVLIGVGATSLRAQNPPGLPSKLAGNFIHVGMIVPNVTQAAKDVADLFGLEPRPINVSSGMVYPTNFRGDPQSYPKTTSFKIAEGLTLELLEPVGGKSPWRDFLDSTNGIGGLQHIAFSVNDIEQPLAFLQQKGGTAEFGGVVKTASAPPRTVRFAYVNMRPKLRLTFELVQIQGQ